MKVNPIFAECIGQGRVKKNLSLYIDSFEAQGRLPFLNLTTQKGGGKTFFARKFREALKRPDGTRPPMIEVNGKTIRNARSFFDQIFPIWKEHGAFLFIDEGHNIPKDLQEIFLTALNVDKNPVRTVHLEGDSFTFDFTKMSFCMATTNQEKLCEPLRDRLRDIAFEDYEEQELFSIFESNLDENIDVSPDAKENIISVFRGNPRDAVVKAQDANTFFAAYNLRNISKKVWSDICDVMSINPHGLSNSETQIVKALAERGSMSLNGLSSITGFQRAAIQRDYEKILVKKNLMKIEGKRTLTPKGTKLALEMGFIL